MSCFAVIAAAGRGSRCGDGRKHLFQLCGQTLLWHTLQPFIACQQVEAIRIVIAADDDQTSAAVTGCSDKIQVMSVGGVTRAESVYHSLIGCQEDDWVLVHDAARPCLSVDSIARLLSAACEEGVVLALPLTDALKKVKGDRIVSVVSRDDCWLMQTPQLFRVGRLRQALIKFPEATDDAEAMSNSGFNPRIIKGEARNIKITYEEDFMLAELFLQNASVPLGRT